MIQMTGQGPLPALDDANRAFWQGGGEGKLCIGWCARCAAWRHPSLEFCPDCAKPITEHRAASGKGQVLAWTHNHQKWIDGIDPPYVIAIVGLQESSDVRLTTNLVNVAPEAVRVGLAVRVVFESREDVWLAKFEPDPECDATPPVVLEPHAPFLRSRRADDKFESRVALTGIGVSQIGRKLTRSALSLMVEACTGAIEDAGLTRGDIDGICAYPGSEGMPGLSQGGVRAVEQALRLKPTWHNGGQEVPGQLGNVIGAMIAVASGLCRHVLCFTAFAENKRPNVRGNLGADRVSGELSWYLPFGCASPVNWLALYASQYCAKYDVDPAFFGNIAVSTRVHASRNPAALIRTPLSLDDYFAARMISSPFRLYDCDVPCDGAMAVIVSAADAARDLKHRPVRIEAVGTQIAEPQSWDQSTLTHQPQVFSAAAHLWSRTDLRAKDVDLAYLYDGFTFNVVSWMEGLGFCAPGETADFIGGGARIALDGALPLNTHGGHLSAGRSNGYGGLLEAVTQLRGQAGGRQAVRANVAVVTSGGAIPAGCMLLSKG